MKRKLFLLLILISGLILPARPQIRHSMFSNYTIRDGHTDNIIHAIYQDSKGWIWLGTTFGSVRFDGYNFVKFHLGTSESDMMTKALVRTIAEDKKGNMWFGTENQGIFIYNREKCKLTQIRKQSGSWLCSNSVWAIVEDHSGKMWIGTENGLECYDPENGRYRIFSGESEETLKPVNDFVRVLRFDHNRNLWIGTNEGLSYFDFNSNTSKNYLDNPPQVLHENEIWEIFEDNRNNIWVGTYLGGLKKFNVVKDAFESVELEENNERASTVRSVVQDKKGNYWVGSRGGLYSFNDIDSEITHYEHIDVNDNSLVHNSVIKLLIDNKGDLWAGTRNGVSHLNFDKQAFGNIPGGKNTGQNLNYSEVYAFWEGSKNDIWIGTENGGINIYNYRTGKISYLTREDGLSNNCIKAFCYAGDSNLLIGTYLGGLNLLEMKTRSFRHFLHDPDDISTISNNDVWSVLKDCNGRIWVATAHGLDQFDMTTGKFQRFGEKYNVNNVLMIYEDSRGRLWAYCENQKLTMIDHVGKTRDYPFKSRAMCHDKDHNLWIGTLGNGLVWLDPETNETKIYTVNDGLCNNIIYGIVNIEDEYLWISTINGISRFDLRTRKFKNYFVNDGLLNNQFNYSAFMRESDGSLVFGGSKGVDFIFLDRLEENRFIPPVVFTDFKVFNEQVPLIPGETIKNTLPNLISETGSIILDYDQNMLSFEFAALNYANSEKNEYQYMLEGFDRGWNKVGNRRNATYTNLDPGDYVLKVIGSNNDGVYNMQGASLNITILPPFWKTLWFRLLLIASLVAISYLIYIFIVNREKLKNQLILERQSARKIQELERLKHQFFMNISHEIRTPISLILGPLDKLLGSSPDEKSRKTYLEIIHRNTLNLARLVNQLLDYRKLETGNMNLELSQGNIQQFLQEVCSSFKELADEKHIELSYHSVQNEIISFFDPDKIEKILNNLLSNALKYTPDKGKVTISVSVVTKDEQDEQEIFIPDFDKNNLPFNKFIQIIVRDTGIGIPTSQVGKIFNRFQQASSSLRGKAGGVGIGLSITKELVIIHKGYISVKSMEGKGSRFKLLLPLISELTRNGSEPVQQVRSNHEISETDEVKRSDQQPILLVVDDNADIKTFLTHHFAPEYQVISAGNGTEGWNRSLEIIPDIIIADIMMPGIDGREFCRRIKKDERTSHIPVIMLTALSSREDQRAGIDAGADDYIVKPFDVSLLKAKINNIISIRKGLRERFSKEMLLKPHDVVLASPDDKFLKKLVQVIEKNIDNIEFDVEKMASDIGVSRTQLYRKIAALTNMSPKEFVKDIRMQRAAQLIIQKKLTISEVSIQTGFNDTAYFRKCFKEKFGTSPSEYCKNSSLFESTESVV